jgi:hypothetical protein
MSLSGALPANDTSSAARQLCAASAATPDRVKTVLESGLIHRKARTRSENTVGSGRFFVTVYAAGNGVFAHHGQAISYEKDVSPLMRALAACGAPQEAS